VKDDDQRLPIHWAVAYNRVPVVELLVAMKDFDPDVEVSECVEKNQRRLVDILLFFAGNMLIQHRMAPAGHLS
jgi:ankyrin repeat protein